MRRIALLLSLGLVAASPASASVVKLGGTAPPGTGVSCVGCTVFQRATSAASPSYTVPAGGGTITSWSVQGAPSSLSCLVTGCSARLQVVRPAAASGYTLAAQSAQQAIPAGKLSTFSTSLPVQAGDVLGLLGTQVPLRAAGGTDDLVGTVTGLPVVGDLLGFDPGGGLVNVSVTLDPAVGGSGGGSAGGSGGGAKTGSTPFAGVALAGRVVRVTRSGVARIVARCPVSAAGSCAGKLVLRSGRVGLGHAAFRIAPGRRGRVNLHVSRKGRKLLRRSARLGAVASLSSHDGSRQRKFVRARLVLRRPGR